jgi:hypothetical protein
MDGIKGGAMNIASMIERLLLSAEPCVRYRTLTGILGLAPADPRAAQACEEIRTSDRVNRMLSLRGADGRIPLKPYNKYAGAHWVLKLLADIGYPPGDASLLPLRDQVYAQWLAPEHTQERIVIREASSQKRLPGVPIIEGRARRCASQEGNALYATLALGLADERADQLAANLIRWQWPDGGWNCDRRASADTSSFMETLSPLRGLAWHARLTGSRESAAAAERAAEVFLQRSLYKRRSDGAVIRADFLSLHYPCFWQYDILSGLSVLAEAGFITDSRCAEALDQLAAKRLADGGFPAESRHYRVVESPESAGASLVDWGGVSRRRANEFVTVTAYTVLRAAGRLHLPDKEIS